MHADCRFSEVHLYVFHQSKAQNSIWQNTLKKHLLEFVISWRPCDGMKFWPTLVQNHSSKVTWNQCYPCSSVFSAWKMQTFINQQTVLWQYMHYSGTSITGQPGKKEKCSLNFGVPIGNIWKNYKLGLLVYSFLLFSFFFSCLHFIYR